MMHRISALFFMWSWHNHRQSASYSAMLLLYWENITWRSPSLLPQSPWCLSLPSAWACDLGLNGYIVKMHGPILVKWFLVCVSLAWRKLLFVVFECAYTYLLTYIVISYIVIHKYLIFYLSHFTSQIVCYFCQESLFSFFLRHDLESWLIRFDDMFNTLP